MRKNVQARLEMLNAKAYRESRVFEPYDPTEELKDCSPAPIITIAR